MTKVDIFGGIYKNDYTSIVGELKVDKEGKINGFRAKHQVLECNKEKLIVGPRKGFTL